ncbi:cytochrome c oxidase subunit 3 [Dasania sp. GY-MA-18]|uniref:Cytochrome c oxidase subunit 3 n=1 Tax=Dasania phycosphaerae TaxID=2950436 RepID=A0A9J6RHH0_9GAMM|nr:MULTISPECIES: cytochrome c oxidase subunit 3 [Dasania]MCR8921471.1 cytochrome c oxidase subunit 3 [Dasania sp. GY-MA-18]MCZ0863899.1 cytochrome c oxidase subunit 3 [Dasania phycosphaerae]MCZ0867627.1 cytochrome c oxidase subunit 3 [Dasania phycosphaerae]
MKILQSLFEKPWLAQAGEAVMPQTSGLMPQRIALRFFLAAVSVLFFLFIITFLSRSQYPDFVPLAGQPWQPFTDSGQLWINSAILLLASLAMQWGVYSSARGQLNASLVALILALLFTVAFMLAQFMVWQQLMALGYYVGSNPANSFYYLLTAIHALHLFGGLLVLLAVIYRFFRSAALPRLHNSLALCASYWHYLLVLWMILFLLLTSRSETYAAIAALCGF